MKALSVLQPAKIKNASQRLYCPTLTTDQTAVIVRCDAYAELDDPTVVSLGYLDRIAVTDERFDNFLDRFLHESNESIESIESVESVESVGSMKSSSP